MCLIILPVFFKSVSYLKSLTLWPVSKTLWPEKDTFTGVWYDDHLCIPTLWPGRRHQTVWWVQTYTGTYSHGWQKSIFFMFDFIGCFFKVMFSLTGIMSILFAGIVMSHYTHHNLSPVTQILMQQTLRTVAFMCGQWFTLILPVSSLVSFYSIFLIPFFIFSVQKHVCLPSLASPSSVSRINLKYPSSSGA